MAISLKQYVILNKIRHPELVSGSQKQNRKELIDMKKTLLFLLAGWMFVLLIWVQNEQHLTSVKHDQNYIKQMQLETRARAITKYGEYYD